MASDKTAQGYLEPKGEMPVKELNSQKGTPQTRLEAECATGKSGAQKAVVKGCCLLLIEVV